MIVEVLGKQFRFDDARTVIDPFSKGAQLPDSMRDILLLSAAESAIIPLIKDPPRLTLDLPLNVGRGDARLALALTDCVMGDLGRHEKQALGLADILLFGGDISKIQLILGGSTDKLRDARYRTDVVERLKNASQGIHSDYSQAVVSSGLPDLRALIWYSKLSIRFAGKEAAADVTAYVKRVPQMAG